jgi:hypothetical protein
MSIFDATSTRAVPELLGSDSNQSKGTTQSKSVFDLEEDLDLLLKLKDVGATVYRAPPFSTTTRTPTKSTHRLVLHLQARAKEDSETREPPLLTTTRNQMTTPNRFGQSSGFNYNIYVARPSRVLEGLRAL